MIRILFLLLILQSLHVKAQKGASVVYEYRREGNLTIKQLLAVNDSVAFETITYNKGSDVKYKKPLGSGFGSHNAYIDRARNLVLTQSQPYNRPRYLVKDTVLKFSWTLVEGEQEILGYTCKKAVAQTGNHTVTAWYAPALPFSFGPDRTGGLPGLILELDFGTAANSIRAIGLSGKAEQIVEPTKGKLITTAEFSKILAALRN
jgi:GLPGLI family protein